MSILSSPRHASKTGFTLVLDMDETMICATLVEESEGSPLESIEYLYDNDDFYDIRVRSFRVPFYDPVETRGTGVRYDCWGVTRPHLEEFLKFAFKYFKYVVLWSAGRDTYVRRVAREITRDTHDFDVIWTYDDCTDKGMGKPLSKLLKEHPELGDLTNIFIVDDKPSSVKKNPKNGIIIPGYEPENTPESLRKDDTALLKLKKWFLRDDVVNAKDVQTLKKSNIFTK